MKGRIKLSKELCDNVLNDPDYIKYCKYYEFVNIDNDDTMKGYFLWKQFHTQNYG